MTDIVERLRKISGAIEALADENGAKVPAAYMREAANEIERLRAGGCARNQRLTQYCAEVPAAVRAVREACARIAEEMHSPSTAAAIRARTEDR